LRKRVPITGEFGDDVLLGFGAGCAEARQRAGVALVPSWREQYSFLAKVSLLGRPFRVENGVVVALSTPFFYGSSSPFSSRALGIAPWALHCCR
jgi:hypothetical protein